MLSDFRRLRALSQSNPVETARNALKGSIDSKFMFHEDIARIVRDNPHQHRAVALQGSGTKRKHYNTVQACFGCCQCKYAYEGTLRHDVYALHQVGSLNRFHKWLHDHVVVPSEDKFNEALLNVYSHDANEHIPWHTDKDDLYSESKQRVLFNV